MSGDAVNTPAPAMPRPEPIVLISRAGKGCRQYCFYTPDELQAWLKRKPYCQETLLVMPMHGRQFLAKQWKPASEVHSFVVGLVTEAQEHVDVAASLAKTVLAQADAQGGDCATWFLSALSKLAGTQPHMRVGDVLQFASAAMPAAAKDWAAYVADKT